MQALNTHRAHWSGTFIAVFQPGEENAAGAKAMVADGIVDKIPGPDVYLGQHVLGSLPGRAVGIRPGPLFSAAASIEITLHGKGSHGSMPNLGVDPIVLGAAILGRLQTIVSREVSPKETAVVTVGSFHAGTTSNIIPDSAVLQLNPRAFNKAVEKHLHEAMPCFCSRNDKARHWPGFARNEPGNRRCRLPPRRQALTLSATSRYSSIWSKFM